MTDETQACPDCRQDVKSANLMRHLKRAHGLTREDAQQRLGGAPSPNRSFSLAVVIIGALVLAAIVIIIGTLVWVTGGEGGDNGVAGEQVPWFRVSEIDGGVLTPTSFAGKSVLLDFMYTDCLSCRINRPQLLELYAETNRADLEILSLSISLLDTPEKLRAYRSDPGGPWLYAPDPGDITSTFGIAGNPYFLLIDSQGRVVREWSGSTTSEQFLVALA